MRQLAYKRTGLNCAPVSLIDLYSEAILALQARMDAGEHIVFPAEPRGTVRRLTLRFPEEIVERLAAIADGRTKSTVIRTAAQLLLQAEG